MSSDAQPRSFYLMKGRLLFGSGWSVTRGCYAALDAVVCGRLLFVALPSIHAFVLNGLGTM